LWRLSLRWTIHFKVWHWIKSLSKTNRLYNQTFLNRTPLWLENLVSLDRCLVYTGSNYRHLVYETIKSIWIRQVSPVYSGFTLDRFHCNLKAVNICNNRACFTSEKMQCYWWGVILGPHVLWPTALPTEVKEISTHPVSRSGYEPITVAITFSREHSRCTTLVKHLALFNLFRGLYYFLFVQYRHVHLQYNILLDWLLTMYVWKLIPTV
jgi:hypothetical protein